MPADRLVEGTIVMIAWQAPIPGERTHPIAPSDTQNAAIGYQIDGSQLLIGPQAVVDPLAKAFAKGGLPAKRVDGPSVGGLALFAIFTTLLVGLEAAGWSIARMKAEHLLTPVADAAADALRVVAKREARPSLVYFRFLARPWLISLVLTLGPYFFGFDIGTSCRGQPTARGTHHLTLRPRTPPPPGPRP